MAYVIPLDQPLSESQAKLIAQMGSMKNLADFSFLKKFKFKKEDGMSMFDYLIKVLRSMGIDPQILITAFLNDLFRTEKLVDLILNATARLATAQKSKLDSSASLSVPMLDPHTIDPNYELTDEDKQTLTDANYAWLNSNAYIRQPLSTVVEALRTRILQELMILLFGKPKKPEAASGPDGLVNDDARLAELIDEASCGGDEIFSVSSPANNTYGELSYNKLQKMEQIKNGNLSFKVTCQGVEISLPDDPMYLFRDAPPGFPSSTTTTPQEAMVNVFSLVANQIQKQTSGGSSQSNSKTGSKSFAQKLLETLISSITCLLSPFFVGIIGAVPGEAQGMAPAAMQMMTDGLLNAVFPGSVTTDPFSGKRVGDYVPATSCEIMQSGYKKDSLTTAQKKKVTLMTILCNLILNMVIGFLLAYVLEKVKKMIIKYITSRAQERAKRKIEKMKDKYNTSPTGKAQKKIDKAAQQVALMSKVTKALQFKNNTSGIPMI